MKTVALTQCPALKEVLWDYHAEEMPEKDAFFFYEARWGYIDEQMLGAQEKKFIQYLTDEYGNGVFMAA